MTLQDQLRQAARDSFPTQTELARELDTSDAMVSRWMNKRTGMSAAKLDRLGEILDVRVQSRKFRK